MPGPWLPTVEIASFTEDVSTILTGLSPETAYEAEADTAATFDSPGKLSLEFTTTAGAPSVEANRILLNGNPLQRWNLQTQRSHSTDIVWTDSPKFTGEVTVDAPDGVGVTITPNAKQERDTFGPLIWNITLSQGANTTVYRLIANVDIRFKRDFSLAGLQIPLAIWANETDMFVVGPRPDDTAKLNYLRKYNMNTKEEVGDGVRLSNEAFTGISGTGTIVYLYRSDQGTALAYAQQGLRATPSNDITLQRARQDGFNFGFTYSGSRWYSAKTGSAKNELIVRSWRSNGRQARNEGKFSVATGGANREVSPPFFYNNKLYSVAQRVDTETPVLTIASLRTNAQANTALTTATVDLGNNANDDPVSCFTDGKYLWVGDREDQRIYAYLLASGEYVG